MHPPYAIPSFEEHIFEVHFQMKNQKKKLNSDNTIKWKVEKKVNNKFLSYLRKIFSSKYNATETSPVRN